MNSILQNIMKVITEVFNPIQTVVIERDKELINKVNKLYEKFTRPYELIYFKDLHRYDVGEWIETTKNSRFFILSKSDEELLFVSELKAGYVNYHIHPDCMLEKFILLSGEYTLKVRNLITHEEWDKHVTEILEMLEVNSDEHHSIIVDENAILLGMLRRKK
jgi:hypothetical protein